MEEAIDQTKYIIAQKLNNKKITEDLKMISTNHKYTQYYGFTNERIAEYLSALQIMPNAKALTVLASGDQAFNLIAQGIKDIDTFDINNLTEYYVFGLKYALICKCNYYEFLEISKKIYSNDTSPYEICSIIEDLIPFMDLKYRTYWQEILNFYIETLKNTVKPFNLFELLIINCDKINKLIFHLERFNAYLANEQSYEQFKTNLTKTNITFTQSNMIDLADNFRRKFRRKYDYLLLSNILDYIYKSWGIGWGKRHLNKYLKSLMPIMKDESLIFLHYCFRPETELIVGSTICKFDIDEIIDLQSKEGLLHSTQIIKRIKNSKKH